jgi:hypothetical protein
MRGPMFCIVSCKEVECASYSRYQFNCNSAVVMDLRERCKMACRQAIGQQWVNEITFLQMRIGNVRCKTHALSLRSSVRDRITAWNELSAIRETSCGVLESSSTCSQCPPAPVCSCEPKDESTIAKKHEHRRTILPTLQLSSSPHL